MLTPSHDLKEVELKSGRVRRRTMKSGRVRGRTSTSGLFNSGGKANVVHEVSRTWRMGKGRTCGGMTS